MAKEKNGLPNPKRVEAGRRNRRKRKGITPEGRQSLRETALRNKPWLHSTGPRSAIGKAKAALNGKKRQVDDVSVRELRSELSDVGCMLERLAALRQQVLGDDR